ncbi:DEAD/DEAH box helicase [Mycoplasma iguanae]|uniref:DEAD/DEAH box helicase n=1 Tax=Mycoplasma iguanae TaxID=292461 RepID=A0ABY5R8J8_9MOLU|nr:DEAD/DEAH box helicase [Mycoplasma iguanae]UVD81497.1 DEAD/DEAH box helicase [Mycoplasma iguanae]
MNFEDLNISHQTKKALEIMGFTKPSPIQEKVIPLAIEGKDIIGQAQTGTGKTAAFAIPIIESTDADLNKIQHLIIAPTRELATQIYVQFKEIGQFHNLRYGLILGGSSYEKQLSHIKGKFPAHIIVATPGRLEDILSTRKVDLSHIKSLTLDEADELLRIGFLTEIENIITYLPKMRQNYFFTATFDKKTKSLSEKMTVQPEKVTISSGLTTSNKIDQKYVVLKESAKLMTLVKFLDLHKPKSSVIFGRTKRRVDELTDALNSLGFKAAGIQGDMQQRERNHVMEKFREQKVEILVATDVMARGIDVEHVEWVFNLDLPQEIEYYTHRIGRTGRAGKFGHSLSFVKPSELPHIKQIAIQTESIISEVQIPSEKELKNVWEQHLISKLADILEKRKDAKYTYVQDDLQERYSHKELAILLAEYVVQDKTSNKEIKLTPEPAVSLRKQQSSRSNNFGNKSRKQKFTENSYRTKNTNYGSRAKTFSKNQYDKKER